MEEGIRHVNGVYVFWTKPWLTGTTGHHMDKMENFSMYKFEILHFIISTLFYRKLNGKTILYTDKVFLNYLKSKGYDIFWDKIDVSKAEEFEKYNINAKTNWTSFKTWLVGRIPTPFLLIDHDNYIYTVIPRELFDTDIRFAHWERLDKSIYPDKDNIVIDNFSFNDNWDWNSDIPNTSLIYINNKEFIEENSNKAMEFYKLNNDTEHSKSDTQYLFADQRLLALIGKEKSIKLDTFSSKNYDLKEENEDSIQKGVGFHHLWIYKHKLKMLEQNPNHPDIKEYHNFMDHHKTSIERVFPEYEELLKPLYSYDS